MAFFSKKSVNNYEFSDLEIKKRHENIPKIETGASKTKSKKCSAIDFESTFIFSFEKKTSTLESLVPPGIEYVSKSKKSKKSLFPDIDKTPDSSEVDQFSKKQYEVGDREMELADMLSNSSQVEHVHSDFSSIPKASSQKIKSLEDRHMNFYSLLSSIQETNIASDFRYAYDIQDKIAYLLNNSHLLFDSLVDELISHLDMIIYKLTEYKSEIDRKYSKFKSYNKSISELKEYKYKTDPSMNIIFDSLDVAKKEVEKNQNIISSDDK